MISQIFIHNFALAVVPLIQIHRKDCLPFNIFQMIEHGGGSTCVVNAIHRNKIFPTGVNKINRLPKCNSWKFKFWGEISTHINVVYSMHTAYQRTLVPLYFY